MPVRPQSKSLGYENSLGKQTAAEVPGARRCKVVQTKRPSHSITLAQTQLLASAGQLEAPQSMTWPGEIEMAVRGSYKSG